MCLLSPGAPLTYFNDGGGGSNRGSYFIPKKIPTSEFVYPKKSLTSTFLAYPKSPSSSVFVSAKFICGFELIKNAIPKIIPVFFHDPKKPSVFYRPKKNPTFVKVWLRFQIQKNSSDPPPSPPIIKIYEWGH